MSTSAFNYSLPLANKVHAESLVPHQQPSRPGFKRQTDFYERCFIKHPGRSFFHSRAEFLHAGLLEGDPKVHSYVPQPFKLWVNGKRYTPDTYVHRDAVREVDELKPKGIFDEAKRDALEQFFTLQNMKFIVISNESVFEREMEAENWIEIVITLYKAKDWDTQSAELDVLDYIHQHIECELGDIVDAGDREGTFTKELALLRLLHKGIVQANLSDSFIDYGTGISLCT